MSNTQWQTVLSEVIGAFLSGKLSFVVHDVAVSISSVTGAPVKFTLATAMFAAENIFLGSTGVLQVGNVLVSIGKVPSSESNATPAAKAMAAAIATSVVPTGSPITGGVPIDVVAAKVDDLHATAMTGPVAGPIFPAAEPVVGMTPASASTGGYPIHTVPH